MGTSSTDTFSIYKLRLVRTSSIAPKVGYTYTHPLLSLGTPVSFHTCGFLDKS